MTTTPESARDEAFSAAQAADAVPLPQGVATSARFASPRAKLSLAVAIVAAIILLAILLPTGASARYTDVREITAAPAAFDGKTVAVVGGVQPGSVEVGSALAFNLMDYGDESVVLRVVYARGMDANFAEGKKVLAQGEVQVVGGVPKLVASTISIGCPTDYRPPPQ